MTHFLVTGGGSFIARHLVEALVRSGHDVTATVRQPNDQLVAWSRHLGIDLKQIDLAIPGALRKLAPHEIVVHAAARSVLGTDGDAGFTRDNVIASQELAAWARQGNCDSLIGLSSVSVYGQPVQGHVNESTPSGDLDEYGRTKLLGEQAIREVADVCRVVTLRLPGVVGRGAHRIWLSRLLRDALVGEPLSVRKPLSDFNNVLHVSDLCGLIARFPMLGQESKGTFLLAARDPIPVLKVVETVATASQSQSKILISDDGPASFVIDDSRARTLLDYESMTTIGAVTRYVRESLETQRIQT